jgi:hypothetical protein
MQPEISINIETAVTINKRMAGYSLSLRALPRPAPINGTLLHDSLLCFPRCVATEWARA